MTLRDALSDVHVGYGHWTEKNANRGASFSRAKTRDPVLASSLLSVSREQTHEFANRTKKLNVNIYQNRKFSPYIVGGVV